MQKLALTIRALFIGVGFLGGLLFVNLELVGESPNPIFPMLAAPVMLILVLGIQEINPLSGDTWVRPSWIENPLSLGQPLQFFHMGSYFMVASGIGVLINSLLTGHSFNYSFNLISFGIGIFLGVRICEKLYIQPAS